MRKYKLLCLALFAINLYAQKRLEQNFIGTKKLYYGVAYYPEAWSESEIEKDIALMKDLHMNVVRMAEFAWSKMEPQEGKYDFAWLHRIIEKLHAQGIDVILGTPTATPPAWMWEKYPQIGLMQYNGVRATHGIRRDCSYTSEIYRKKSIQICEKMAQEFGNKPGVIGWQTDNEFGHTPDYSEETKKRFHAWLKTKYKTIQNLNRAWVNVLWSQEYDKFEQIPLPRDDQWYHPSLRFEWHRFTNDMITEYQDLQLKAIRKYSKLPITHDGMPGQMVDYEKLCKDLDFMSHNNYHSFEAYDRIVSNCDRMRGYNKGFYWLFETAPNHSGGGNKGQTWRLHDYPNSMNAALWMQYALGAQGTMFWLWRQHPAGQEMVHGAVLHTWGVPFANIHEIKKLGEDISKTSDFLINNPVEKPLIAILYSHEADIAFKIEQYASNIKYYEDWTFNAYLPLLDAHLHRDVIAPSHDIDSYKIIFIPFMPYVPESFRAKLKKWVEEGGTLVLGPMVGYRDSCLAAQTQHATGDWETWTGISVEARMPLGATQREAEQKIKLNWNLPLQTEDAICNFWTEALSTKGTTWATYQNGFLSGKPAIASNQVGKGKVVFLGTGIGRKNLSQLFLYIAKEQGIQPLAYGDKDVIVVPRKGTSQGTVIVNIANETKKIMLPSPAGKDLLSGKYFDAWIELKPYEVLIFEKKP
ncbi:MAG: beta-galactosidase [Cytophagales bacterium]|nr:beta-galactosidase [Cytophagales bacterium]MDW8383375.1 beta-galactosidase [Flammeovirgaceae bacterium]